MGAAVKNKSLERTTKATGSVRFGWGRGALTHFTGRIFSIDSAVTKFIVQ